MSSLQAPGWVFSGPVPQLAANSHGTVPGDLDVKSGQDSSTSPMPALTGPHHPWSMPILPGRVKPGAGCRKTISTQFLVLPLGVSGAAPPPILWGHISFICT